MYASNHTCNLCQEVLPAACASAKTNDGARLDIAANGFWCGRFEQAYFDVWIFNSHDPSNQAGKLWLLPTECMNEQMLELMSNAPKRWNTALSPPSSCPSLKELDPLPRSVLRLVSMLFKKGDQPYSSTLAWMWCKLSFTLLCSSIQAIRGACPTADCASRHVVLPVDLLISEAGFDT